MPLTPFHFGPGLLCKAPAPRRFSFTAFAATQVVIDCETLYHILRREYPLHRGLHTLVGATLAGAATSAALWAVSRAPIAKRAVVRSELLRSEFGTPAIWLGGLVGGFSHPLLDGIMHPDVRPFGPWSDANPLLGVIGLDALHLACVAAGIVGLALLARWLESASANARARSRR